MKNVKQLNETTNSSVYKNYLQGNLNQILDSVACVDHIVVATVATDGTQITTGKTS